MATLKTLSDQLAALADELEQTHAFDDATPYEARVILAAAGQARSGALMLGALLEHRHAEQLEQLARLCRCGHDQGDHLVDAPHACEAVSEETDEHGSLRIDPCLCARFEIEPRDTRRAPPPALVVVTADEHERRGIFDAAAAVAELRS